MSQSNNRQAKKTTHVAYFLHIKRCSLILLRFCQTLCRSYFADLYNNAARCRTPISSRYGAIGDFQGKSLFQKGNPLFEKVISPEGTSAGIDNPKSLLYLFEV
jgi:hypothetical protein